MLGMDNGFYWVKGNAGDPWEVAFYHEEAWWFCAAEHGVAEVAEIGPHLEPPGSSDQE